MGWKRNLMEGILATAKKFTPNVAPNSNHPPHSIFVLRNNDLGDLLGVTPMFAAIKKTWPACRLGVGVGDWSRPILENNPWIDEVLPANAPWHNKAITKQGVLAGLQYALFSSEASVLARQRFDAGIDPLGSTLGSLLMIRCRIPTRIGVQGYAGGHSANTVNVRFDLRRHVGCAALASAKTLGADIHSIKTAPQLFLTAKEDTLGEEAWTPPRKRRRLIIAPGAGFLEKRWPLENFVSLTKLLLASSPTEILILGSREDAALAQQIEQKTKNETTKGQSLLRNLCGRTNLRETFAITARCDAVISNTSLLMHVAGAFGKPNLVLLGPWYESAVLHASQWAHENTVVLGRETSEGENELTNPEAAFRGFEGMLATEQPQ